MQYDPNAVIYIVWDNNQVYVPTKKTTANGRIDITFKVPGGSPPPAASLLDYGDEELLAAADAIAINECQWHSAKAVVNGIHSNYVTVVTPKNCSSPE
jgi:hypothetical protein